MQLIDENIWKLFLEYSNYISSNGVESGLDVYGTEQKTSLAASLTIAHFLNDISTELKNSNHILLFLYQHVPKRIIPAPLPS